MTFATLEGVERRFGGPHGYGHRGFSRQVLGVWDKKPAPTRTPFAQLARRLGLRPRAVDGALLRDAVLSPRGPGIYDQGATSSCTGNDKCGAAMTRFVAMGNPSPYRLSPACAYKIGRRIDVPPNADGSLVPLVDDGAIPEQITRALAEWGVCSYDKDPTDPRTINLDPDLGELEQALALIVRGIYGIAGDIGSREAQVQLAIDSGFPVSLGALIDDTFENWAGGNPCGPPAPERILGGHAMYVVDWAPWAGGTEYVLVNSWGTGAGESGFFRVSADWLEQASDLEVVDINHNGGVS